MVLAVPDGRSVRTLINATPIRAEGGEIESVVVTMQDLAPLDEIERMRTAFLGLAHVYQVGGRFCPFGRYFEVCPPVTC